MWDATKRVPRLVQEVREHTKAVTCLYIPSPGDKLYSGSLDKTIRASILFCFAVSIEIPHSGNAYETQSYVGESILFDFLNRL